MTRRSFLAQVVRATVVFDIGRVTQPANGTVDIDRRGGRPDRVRYRPRDDFFGTDTFTYTALDFEGTEGAPATVTITVTPVNDRPNAVDDSATTRQGRAVTISVLANDTDVDGDSLTIAFVDNPHHGTAVIAGNAVTYTPDADFSGTDRFDYRARDASEDSDRATVTVVVTPNAAPIATITGGNRTIPDSDRVAGENVHLDGSTSSDPDGTIASYRWFNQQQLIGSGPTIDVRLPDGDNVIRLEVTDNDGATGSSTATISVETPNGAPTARITGGNRTIPDSDRVAGENVHLDGSTSSDPDGTIASYRWFNQQQLIGSDATIDVRLPDGDNVIRLEVTDDDGATGSSTATITVEVPPANGAPTARITGGNRTIPDSDRVAGENVHLDGSASSDPDGTIASYRWFNQQQLIGSEATIDVRLPDGDNAIRLVVTDNDGATGSSTATISVAKPPANVAPIATITGGNRTIPDSDRVAGENVHLDGSTSSDPDGTIASYRWFNQQQLIGSGPTIDVRLPDGDTVIRLEVTDDGGATGSSTATISVEVPSSRTSLQSLPGLTPNQHSVAVALDDLCLRLTQQSTLTEGESDLLARCNGIVLDNDPARQTTAVSELGAQDLNAIQTQTLLLARDLSVGVMDRLMALRSGAGGLSAAPGLGLSLTVDGKAVPPEMLKLAADEVVGSPTFDNREPLFSDRWGFWMRGNFGTSKKSDSLADPGFDADQWGISGGADYRSPQEQAMFGLALGIGESDTSFNPSDEGGLNTSAWNISLYGGLYPEDGLFYADGFVAYGHSSLDSERRIHYLDAEGTIDRTAQGSSDGSTLSVGVSAGHDFLVGPVTVSPNARLNYIDATVNGFRESGADGLDLIYDKQDFDSATASIGARITGAWNLGWIVLLPHFRADAVWEFSDSANAFGVRFANDPFAGTANPTPPIIVTSEAADQSFMIFTVGMAAQLRYGISAYVEYTTLEGLEFLDVSDLALGMRIQYNFR